MRRQSALQHRREPDTVGAGRIDMDVVHTGPDSAEQRDRAAAGDGHTDGRRVGGLLRNVRRHREERPLLRRLRIFPGDAGVKEPAEADASPSVDIPRDYRLLVPREWFRIDLTQERWRAQLKTFVDRHAVGRHVSAEVTRNVWATLRNTA